MLGTRYLPPRPTAPSQRNAYSRARTCRQVLPRSTYRIGRSEDATRTTGRVAGLVQREVPKAKPLLRVRTLIERETV